jgi:hypothetical protein
MSEFNDQPGSPTGGTPPVAVVPERPDSAGHQTPGRRSATLPEEFWRLAAQPGRSGPSRSAKRLTTFVVVAAMVAIVIWQLHPSLLFLNTTDNGGDTGAHVMLPYYLEHYLLPRGQITGWSPAWYDGFPLLTFYFPLPYLLVVVFNALFTYNVAFKLVTVLGMVTLPLAAWAMGRLARAPRPVPACLAVATLPYLFDRSYTIYGGNIFSTLAGEFAFSIGLSAALVFIGVVAYGLRTGRGRGWAAALLALIGLCHMVPALYAGVGGGVMALLYLERPLAVRLRWILGVGIGGVAIIGFWIIPFFLRLQYTSSMGYKNLTNLKGILFGSDLRPLIVLSVVATAISIVRGRLLGRTLAIVAVLSAISCYLDPQGKLFNARLVPLWYISVFLMAGLAVGEILLLLGGGIGALGGRGAVPSLDQGVSATRARFQRGEQGWLANVFGPIVVAVAAGVFVLVPLINAPTWLPSVLAAKWNSVSRSEAPNWVDWNYTGYQEKPAWPEYHQLMTVMADLGKRYGCGRAMWEYGPSLNNFGTTMAPMILPYWTDGCIDSMEGLLFESSATTPYHFLNQAELSESPDYAMAGLPYGALDVPLGVQHLQILGVKYFMAFSPQVQAEADQDPSLQLVDSSGPWYFDGTDQTWDIYLVKDSPTVAPLANWPVVDTGVGPGGHGWLEASLAWYTNPSEWSVMRAQFGPSSWPRVPYQDTNAPVRPAPATVVSKVVTRPETISFDVSRLRTPVVVKTSYFPNWQAEGALGPYRVSPNLMVVEPTSHHVVLHYGYTPVDWFGAAVSVAGILAAVVMNHWPLFGPVPTGSRPDGYGTAGGTEPEPGPSSDPALVPAESSALGIGDRDRPAEDGLTARGSTEDSSP